MKSELEKAKINTEKCLNDMYKKSTPSITWKEILKRYGNTKIEFYRKHEITEEQYDKIRDKYIKKIPKWLQTSFLMSLLDFSPTIKRCKNDKKI